MKWSDKPRDRDDAAATSSFLTVLRSEAIKLRGSLVGLLSFAVPSFVVLVSVVIVLKQGAQADQFLTSMAAAWAYIMLPLGVAALSALAGHIEHGSRAFDHLLALPGVRGRIFLAKGLIFVAVVAVWHILLFVLALLGAGALQNIAPESLAGSLQVQSFAQMLAMVWGASLLLVAIQLWVALWFRSFVWPLALGVFGAFAGIVTAGAEEGLYFPWSTALHVMHANAANGTMAVTYGIIGGGLTLVAMHHTLKYRRW
ncbi:ABC transporter permease [Erythrobacter sp. HA6-11]